MHVTEKRADGFHNIETCFYPAGWSDVLEIFPAAETKLILSGIEIQGEPTSNIIYKAYELLRQDFSIAPVEIYLHKVIPHGAGLGGGSSDGAHTLKLLNQLFLLKLSDQQLKDYALKLGSDCPFFIESKPIFAKGRGEVLSPVSVSLSGFYLVIIKPEISVSTTDAYSRIIPRKPKTDLLTILNKPVSTWNSLLKNDFEDVVFEKHIGIRNIKEKLYQSGAVYAAMSGSGSAIFGIFESPINLEKDFPDCTVWGGVM